MTPSLTTSIPQRVVAALWLMAIGAVWIVALVPMAIIAAMVRISPRRRD